ncbi:hypothetical protein DSO57_1020957 [Entomophthora muscae]|uniref:Uncharacterized protein n=1 Tax=Entomophthora muscae TaxID=34485 RepID=A0ACC2SSS3_9FUNG|nr:hypothetical protein DSO57_1020957 [Entomophthora muscae]
MKLQDTIKAPGKKMVFLEEELVLDFQEKKEWLDELDDQSTLLYYIQYCGVPVHQSSKCVLDCSQGPAGRGFHSLKKDPLRNLLVFGPGGQGNKMDFPILGVLQQFLGLLVLGLWLLHFSLEPLYLGLGLLRSGLGLLWSGPALASYPWSLAPSVAFVAFVIHFSQSNQAPAGDQKAS